MPFPQPPDVQPQADPRYWAVLDIEVTWASPTCHVRCLTDSPVQLFMHATTAEPALVPQHRVRRGIMYETIPRWISPSGSWLPQAEHGDSSVHTFPIDDWPEGVGLWYYFDGYSGGRVTVSSSVLFGSVRPPPDFNPTAGVAVKPIFNLDLNRSIIYGITPRATIIFP